MSDTTGATPLTALNSSKLSLSPMDADRVYQRDTNTGNPAGFDTTFNKGWGEVDFKLAARESGAVRIRLRDSTDPTKVLQNWIDWPVNVSVGENVLKVNIPAGLDHYVADLELASDPSSIVTSTPFGVGTVDVATGQSMATSFFEPYAYYGPADTPLPSTIVPDISPNGVVFAPVNHLSYNAFGQLNLGSTILPWLPPGDNRIANYESTFGAEYLRLRMAQTGVCAALIGFGDNGKAISAWAPGPQLNDFDYLEMTLAHADMKFDTFIWCQGGTDALSSTLVSRYEAALNTILDQLQSEAARPFKTILFDYGYYGHGDSARNYSDVEAVKEEVASTRSDTFYTRGLDTTYYYNGHPTMLSRVRGARALYRAVLDAIDPNADHGPSLTGTGTRNGALIDLGVRQDRGTMLLGTVETEVGTSAMNYRTATNTDLAGQFSAFQAGFTDNAHRLKIIGSAIVNATTIRLQLSAAPTGDVDIWYRTDEDASGSQANAIIRDDVVDGDGIPYGRELQPYNQAITIFNPSENAANNSAPSITVQDGLTSQRAQDIGGTADVGNTVSIFDGGVLVGLAVVGSDNRWSVAVSLAGEGKHRLVATATDSDGNVSPASSPVIYMVDTVAPALPVLVTRGTLTSQLTQIIAGAAEVGSTVSVIEGGALLGSSIVSAYGTWSASITMSGAGLHNLVAIATDVAGNVSPQSAPITYTLDLTPPSPPLTGQGGYVTAPWLTGTAEPGSKLTIYENGEIVGSGPIWANGAFHVQVGLVGDGAHHVVATATDPAGNESVPSVPIAYVLDTVAPAPPTITTQGRVTNRTTQMLVGTAEAGSTVVVLDGTKQLASTKVGADGNWTAQVSILAEGAHRVVATAIDAAHNVSTAATAVTFDLDTTKPPPPMMQGVDLGTAGEAIRGVAEAGSIVSLFEGSTRLASVVVAEDGSWSAEIGLFKTGLHTLSATATDLAGNSSSASLPVTFTSTGVSPIAPVITTQGGLTRLAEQVITGVAEAGSAVSLFDGGVKLASAFAAADGKWSATVSLSGTGVHNIVAATTDAAGNAGPTSVPVALTLDMVAPVAPVITAQGGPTHIAGQVVTGIAEAGSAVSLFDGDVKLASAFAAADGKWSATISLSGAGVHNIVANATDAAGNTGPASVPVAFTLDTTAPAAPNFSLTRVATNLVETATGGNYDGPLTFLKQEFIWGEGESVAISSSVPNVFIHGGPNGDAIKVFGGSNVLDGGGGSDFLVGSAGLDGGADTFFLDGRGAKDSWSTIVGFHIGDMVTVWGFQPENSRLSWSAREGASGFEGATMHSEITNSRGTVEESVTFAGLGLDQVRSQFSTTMGTVQGNPYLLIG